MAGNSAQFVLTALLDCVKTNEALKRTCAAMLTELQAIRKSLEDDPNEAANASTATALAGAAAGGGDGLGLGGGLEEAIKEIAAEELGFDPTAAGGMEKGALKALLKSKIAEQRAAGAASNNKT